MQITQPTTVAILILCCLCPSGKAQKGREATAPSFIKEIQEVQGGQEEPHNVGAIIPKDT
jgi:hypothetical protein